MGPIFNKKVAEKCNCGTREQCTYALFTVDKVNYCGLENKKKKKKNADASFIAIQTGTTLQRNSVGTQVTQIFLMGQNILMGQNMQNTF